jgi:hypothetical protein
MQKNVYTTLMPASAPRRGDHTGDNLALVFHTVDALGKYAG